MLAVVGPVARVLQAPSVPVPRGERQLGGVPRRQQASVLRPW